MSNDDHRDHNELEGHEPEENEQAGLDDDLEAGVEEAKRIAEEEEAGYRHLDGWDRWVIPTVAVSWCIFQLSIASWLLIDTVIIRAIHLGFAMLIAFMSYPALKKPRTGFWSFLSTRTRIPVFDYAMALIGCLASLYIWIDYLGISSRQGAPLTRDLSLIHISEPTRQRRKSRMPSSA